MKLLSHAVAFIWVVVIDTQVCICDLVHSTFADPILHTLTGDIIGRTQVNKVSGEHHVSPHRSSKPLSFARINGEPKSNIIFHQL